MRIAVIGSGIGGLATACILAKAGHRVVVYEKNEVHGGRAAVLKDQGFTFDMGPSWYLMPDVFERFFAAIGEDIHKHLNLIKLDPAYRIYFEEDTTPTDIHSSVEKTAALFEKIEPGAGTVFAEYVQRTKAQYELAVGHFLYRDYRSVFHVFNTKVFSALSIIPWYGTIDGYVRRFFQSAKIRKVLEYTTVFLGVSPSTAPALYAMMAYVDFGLGVYYSQGGIGKLIEAFVTIAKKHGVEFHLNKPVTSIETEHGVATAIRFADGTRDTFDVVISNADMHHTETALLKTEDQSYPESSFE
jgi:phytoene desaturase